MKNFRSIETGSLLWVYSAMILAAALGDLVGQGDALAAWRLTPRLAVGNYILGIFTVFIFSVGFFLYLRMFQAGLELDKILRQVLTPLSYLQVILLAILGGIAEEWFFRGYLLPRYGLIFSSIFFALAHLLPGARSLGWLALNFVLGLALGAIFKATSSLIWVAFIHTLFQLGILFQLNASTSTPGFRSR